MARTKVDVVAGNDRNQMLSSEVEILQLSTGARFLLALKPLGLCWGAALPIAFIPVLHLLLVPLCVFAGLFLFFYNFSLRHLLVRGGIRCPKCQTLIDLPPKAFNWPRKLNCPQCQVDLIVKQEHNA